MSLTYIKHFGLSSQNRVDIIVSERFCQVLRANLRETCEVAAVDYWVKFQGPAFWWFVKSLTAILWLLWHEKGKTWATIGLQLPKRALD